MNEYDWRSTWVACLDEVKSNATTACDDVILHDLLPLRATLQAGVGRGGAANIQNSTPLTTVLQRLAIRRQSKPSSPCSRPLPVYRTGIDIATLRMSAEVAGRLPCCRDAHGVSDCCSITLRPT
jgi:hypothetical protein